MLLNYKHTVEHVSIANNEHNSEYIPLQKTVRAVSQSGDCTYRNPWIKCFRIEKESLDNCELAGEINLFFSYLGETNPIVRRLIDIPAQNPLLTYPTVEGSAR